MSADGHSAEKWTEPQFGMCAAGRQDDCLDAGLERQTCSEDQVATPHLSDLFRRFHSVFILSRKQDNGRFFLSSSNTVQPLIWALIHRPCLLLHNLSIQHSETHTSLAPEKRTQCAKSCFLFIYFFKPATAPCTHCLWPLLLHRGSIWCWSLSQPLCGDGGVTQGHIVIHNHPHLALTVKYSQPEVQSLLMHI